MELACVTKITIANPDLGDLMLDEAGTGFEVVHTTLAAEVAQRIHVRLKFFKGEWFLDLEEGTPWYEELLKKGVDDATVRSIFGQVIGGCPGVAELSSLTYSLNKTTRMLALRFVARLDDGTTLRSADFGEFKVFVQ